MKDYGMYVDGEWTDFGLGKIDVTNPSTGEVIATVPNGGSAEAEKAADAAFRALKGWSALSVYERSELIWKWHHLINEHKEEIARVMTLEQGKPIKEAIGEMTYANGFLSWYAEEGKRIYGETIPATQRDKRLFVSKQPVGVVAAITPWNFPAAMITRKVGPALAAGCTIIVKPAGMTPLTALKMAELAEEAGIPKGVLNIVTGKSSEISKAWMEDTRVRKLTFTGSTEVGKELMKGSADTVKKVSLELGGHAPVIILEDADLDKAAKGVIDSKFRNAGQTCVCSNRVYVHESVYDKFLEKLVPMVKALKVADGLEEGADIGPLINKDAVDKVLGQIEDAVQKGARLEAGGKSKGGLFLEPAVLSGITDDMLCMREETFGPLAPIASFKTEEEAIRRANDSIYGLAAYVFTENISRGIRVTEALEYGIIGLNDGLPSTPQAPFGGFKQSGLGREGGHHGIDEFLEVKYISLGL